MNVDAEQMIKMFLDQVDKRVDTDPEFMGRIRMVRALLAPLADGDEVFLTAMIGAAGLALHVDDMTSGRLKP